MRGASGSTTSPTDLTKITTDAATAAAKDAKAGNRFSRSNDTLNKDFATFVAAHVIDIKAVIGEFWRNIAQGSDGDKFKLSDTTKQEDNHGRLIAIFQLMQVYTALTNQSAEQLMQEMEFQYGYLEKGHVATFTTQGPLSLTAADQRLYTALKAERIGVHSAPAAAGRVTDQKPTISATTIAVEINKLADIVQLHETSKKKPEIKSDDKAAQKYLAGNDMTTAWKHLTQFRTNLVDSLKPETYLKAKGAWKKPWNEQVANNLTAFLTNRINFAPLKEALMLAVQVTKQHEANKVTGKRGVLTTGDKTVVEIRRELAKDIFQNLAGKLERVQNVEQLYDLIEPWIRHETFIKLSKKDQTDSANNALQNPNEKNLGDALSFLLNIHKQIATNLKRPIIGTGKQLAARFSLVVDTRNEVDKLADDFEKLTRVVGRLQTNPSLANDFERYSKVQVELRGRSSYPRRPMLVGVAFDEKTTPPTATKSYNYTCFQLEALIRAMVTHKKPIHLFSTDELSNALAEAAQLQNPKPAVADDKLIVLSPTTSAALVQETVNAATAAAASVSISSSATAAAATPAPTPAPAAPAVETTATPNAARATSGSVSSTSSVGRTSILPPAPPIPPRTSTVGNDPHRRSSSATPTSPTNWVQVLPVVGGTGPLHNNGTAPANATATAGATTNSATPPVATLTK
jgi:hypothetical protein